MSKKVLLMLYPGCISFETMLAVEILGQTFPVEVVTTNDAVHTDASGLKLEPHVSFDDVQLENYVALLVPGGNPDGIIGEAAVQELVLKAHATGLVIGGICAGAIVLADSGILRGHQVTHNYTAKYAPEEVVEFTARFWEKSEYIDLPCVESDNIVTAMPNAYVDFATTLAQKLGVYSSEQAQKMNHYYKGQPF